MNILLLAILILIVIKIIDGYKKGMVKEIISFVSLVFMSILMLLVGAGLHSYMNKEILGVIIAVLLLVILGIAHHILKLVFFSAKLIAKLPVIHRADKVLGMVVGALEVLFMLWTIYALNMYFNLGVLGRLLIEYSRDSQLLTWIYEYNMLAVLVEKVLGSF